MKSFIRLNVRSSVLLPHPDGPMSAVTRRARTSKDTSSIAGTPEYRTDTSRASKTTGVSSGSLVSACSGSSGRDSASFGSVFRSSSVTRSATVGISSPCSAVDTSTFRGLRAGPSIAADRPSRQASGAPGGPLMLGTGPGRPVRFGWPPGERAMNTNETPRRRAARQPPRARLAPSAPHTPICARRPACPRPDARTPSNWTISAPRS